jgi:hypothetical protein
MDWCTIKNNVLATIFWCLTRCNPHFAEGTIVKTNHMSQTIQHSISLGEAMVLTTRFRNNRPANMPLSETFDKSSVLQMLQVSNATSLRLYLGQKENGDICNVLVAADEEGNDILPPPATAGLTEGDDDVLILEDSFRCPELCPPPSPLNE